MRVGTKCHRINRLAFQHRLLLVSDRLIAHRKLKAAVLVQHNRLCVGKFFCRQNQPFTGSLFVIEHHALYGHPAEVFLVLRMGCSRFRIGFQCGNMRSLLLNICRELRQQFVFQTIFLALMVSFQNFQLSHLHIKVHLFLNQRVSGTQRLDFGVRERLLIHIIAGTHRGFAGHNLRDKSLFIFQCLPKVRVKSSFRDIVEHLHLFVAVSLPDDTAVALSHITGFPADIQMMNRHKPVLHIGACTHFCSAAQQNPHIAGAHFGEQCRLFCFSVRRMDKGHLTFRHACGQQLCFDVIINIELPIVFRGRKITEQQLRQFLLPAVLPDLQHIPHTGIQFAGRVIGQQRIHQPLVKADFPAVIRDAEHVVLGRIHSTGMHLGCTLTQILHHFFLDFRRLYNHRFKL